MARLMPRVRTAGSAKSDAERHRRRDAGSSAEQERPARGVDQPAGHAARRSRRARTGRATAARRSR